MVSCECFELKYLLIHAFKFAISLAFILHLLYPSDDCSFYVSPRPQKHHRHRNIGGSGHFICEWVMQKAKPVNINKKTL